MKRWLAVAVLGAMLAVIPVAQSLAEGNNGGPTGLGRACTNGHVDPEKNKNCGERPPGQDKSETPTSPPPEPTHAEWVASCAADRNRDVKPDDCDTSDRDGDHVPNQFDYYANDADHDGVPDVADDAYAEVHGKAQAAVQTANGQAQAAVQTANGQAQAAVQTANGQAQAAVQTALGLLPPP